MKAILKRNLLFILIVFLTFSSFISIPVQSAGDAGEVTIGPGQPNTILVNTNPPGASIYLNDKLLDVKSNTVINKIPDGIHIIKLTLKGYYDYEKIIGVSSEGTTYVTYKFEKKENSFRIVTDPKGADIYIDGVFRGKTDQIYILDAGKSYSIQLSLPGYYTYNSTVYLPVKAGIHEMEGIHHDFTPLPEFGSIDLCSVPNNAEIFLDGNYSGKSNTILNNVIPGTHTIKLSKIGFDDLQTSILVSVEKQAKLNFTLRPQDGIINIDSKPVKGSVYIDGSYVGDAPFNGKYTQGKHKVEVKSTAFDTAFREVDLNFQGQVILVELTPLAQSEILVSERKITENDRYNPINSKEMLVQSRQEVERGEYVQAYESARTAGNLAEDVDEDGIPNWLDIQPNVKNSYVYSLPFVIFIALAGILVYDWRRCRVVPTVDVRIDKTRGNHDTILFITPSVDNKYSSLLCSIYLDNIFIDSIDRIDEHRINLGHLVPEKHILMVELFVKKKRYGRTIISKTIEFEVT